MAILMIIISTILSIILCTRLFGIPGFIGSLTGIALFWAWHFLNAMGA